MAPKKYLVKLKVQPAYLKTLPAFVLPKPKSRAKKLAETRPSGGSLATTLKAALPAPHDEPKHKEMSTAGLTVNLINLHYTLDKSGRPCKRWVRATREFKTFSGFTISTQRWATARVKEEAPQPALETVPAPEAAPTPGPARAAGLPHLNGVKVEPVS